MAFVIRHSYVHFLQLGVSMSSLEYGFHHIVMFSANVQNLEWLVSFNGTFHLLQERCIDHVTNIHDQNISWIAGKLRRQKFSRIKFHKWVFADCTVITKIASNAEHIKLSSLAHTPLCTQCSADYATLLCKSFPKKANCIYGDGKWTPTENELSRVRSSMNKFHSEKGQTNKVVLLLVLYFAGSLAFQSVAIKDKKTRSSIAMHEYLIVCHLCMTSSCIMYVNIIFGDKTWATMVYSHISGKLLFVKICDVQYVVKHLVSTWVSSWDPCGHQRHYAYIH